MSEITLTKENFEVEVKNSTLPVLIDFWAEWCGPCRMLSPIISEIAEEYEGRVKVGKVNVDDEAELAAAFSVESIPDRFGRKGRSCRRGFDRLQAEGRAGKAARCVSCTSFQGCFCRERCFRVRKGSV